jgi:hypothetical protein
MTSESPPPQPATALSATTNGMNRLRIIKSSLSDQSSWVRIVCGGVKQRDSGLLRA